MYLVIDVGGTYTKYGYYNEDGSSLKNGKFETVKSNKEEFYNSIIALVTNDIKGIALSMPGLIDNKEGIIHAITLLPFLKKQNIINDLQMRTNKKVTIENDAKCAALGELWKGNLQNIDNGLFIILGSGIGGTLIINGELVISPRFKAGEIGSILMPLDNDYYTMTNFGANNNANALIKEISRITGCKEDGSIVFEEIIKNNEAMILFRKYCRQIAFMIYNLDYILDLDSVVIGGGISEQDILISTINNEFTRLRDKYEEDNHRPIISNCKHFNEANLLGALSHHIKSLEK